MPGGLGAFALVVAAAVVVLALVLVWLLSRDREVARTSFGFYVARDRYEELPPTAEQTTLEHTVVHPPPEPPAHGWPGARDD